MKAIDDYQRAVERSHEENIIGRSQGQIAQVHSDDAGEDYPTLGDVVQSVVEYFRQGGRELSAWRPLPIAEFGSVPFPCAETLDA